MSHLVTLVTGAGSGIGRATALSLAGPGRALLLTTRGNALGLEEVAGLARGQGAEVAKILCDLSAPGAATDLLGAAQARFGRVDQVVSNAGHALKKTMAETTPEELDHAMALNTRPFLELVRAARSDLTASSCGRVVAVTSFVAERFGVNDALFPTTAASKSALVALAKSLAFELAPSGVTVNCVSPGYTVKDGGRGALSAQSLEAAACSTPNGRLAEPQDIAAAIAFFLSEEARHITGQVLAVDGGLTLR